MRYLFIGWVVVSLLFVQCRTESQKAGKTVSEVKASSIELAGEIANSKSEISGLAWYKDHLILLPQYPDRFNNCFFAIAEKEIEAYLFSGEKEALTPIAIPLKMSEAISEIDGFEGFEAIVFKGDSLFVSIESEVDDHVYALILSGKINPDLSGVEIYEQPSGKVISRSGVNNMSEETLVLLGNKIMSIHEANGINVNSTPKGVLFDHALNSAGEVEFPATEYRITDATEIDSSGKFWTINYLYPGDKKGLNPGLDSLALKHGSGVSHQHSAAVERLLEFQYTGEKIIHSGAVPIYLQLDMGKDSRNWEGLVRFQDKGFLMATDRFPKTILAFVPYHK